MSNTLDMKEIRYLNLFSKITHVNTRFCFNYNEILIFCVPKNRVYKAVGENGKNVKKISELLNKRIKILSIPKDENDAKEFIKNIVSPVQFKELEVTEDEIILNAGKTSKASLIGREKKRLKEMQKISQNFFNKEFRIV